MRLNELRDNAGANKTRVRVGRGIGSGIGKTSGRGGKGQTARSGVRLGGFEGGQMPLHRRLQQAIDAKLLDASRPVDVTALIAAGVLRRPQDGLRLLGEGEIKTKLSITVNHASAAAKQAIEKAGGTVTVIVPKVLAADVAKREKTAAKKAKKGKTAKPATEE